MTNFTIITCATCGATFSVENISDVCDFRGLVAGALVGCCDGPASIVMKEVGKDLKVELKDDNGEDSYCWSPPIPKGRFDMIISEAWK